MHSFKYSMCALVVCGMAALNISVAQAGIEIQNQGNISYVTGGVGLDESDEMEAMRRSYNLRITSADKSGHFFGDTRIVVSDSRHHRLLDVTGGPLFYVNLPNGNYTVEGFTGMQSKKQTVTIAGGKSVNIHFSWQQNFADANNN